MCGPPQCGARVLGGADVPKRFARNVTSDLERILSSVMPGARLLEVEPFAVDEAGGSDGATRKGVGYGVPLRLRVALSSGQEQQLVFHTASPDQFGHDRRADRAAEMLLSYDRFARIPGHVQAVDVGAIKKDGSGLISLRDAGEFYLVTRYAEGHLYADELRRVAARGRATTEDEAHCEKLALELVNIHDKKYVDETRYRRAVRDLVGSGEGIFGMIDAYAPDVPSAGPERLQAIERECVRWRWRLATRPSRLARTHGDFHPFNVLLSDSGEVALLDSSRGSMGDPADDVTCMAINYVFFAVERPETWHQAFRGLWERFWSVYLEHSRDAELLDVCAPYLAWRGLVVANPVWYPAVDAGARDRVLKLIEKALAAERFDPNMAQEIFE